MFYCVYKLTNKIKKHSIQQYNVYTFNKIFLVSLFNKITSLSTLAQPHRNNKEPTLIQIPTITSKILIFLLL